MMKHKPGDLALHYTYQGHNKGMVPEIVLVVNPTFREVYKKGNLWLMPKENWVALQPIEDFEPLIK